MTTGWTQDVREIELGHEAPGGPVPGGLVHAAVPLVDSYQFCDPRILRAVYRQQGDLLGRDMLLEVRFLLLRFLVGVRIAESHDEVRDGGSSPERVIGWSYRTLHGHLEQGSLTYDVVKEQITGRVAFRIAAYHRRAPIANPVIRLGFRMFARPLQLRFYRTALRRLRKLVHTAPVPPRAGPDGIVHVPSGFGGGRFAFRIPHPAG